MRHWGSRGYIDLHDIINCKREIENKKKTLMKRRKTNKVMCNIATDQRGIWGNKVKIKP